MCAGCVDLTWRPTRVCVCVCTNCSLILQGPAAAPGGALCSACREAGCRVSGGRGPGSARSRGGAAQERLDPAACPCGRGSAADRAPELGLSSPAAAHRRQRRGVEPGGEGGAHGRAQAAGGASEPNCAECKCRCCVSLPAWCVGVVASCMVCEVSVVCRLLAGMVLHLCGLLPAGCLSLPSYQEQRRSLRMVPN